MSRICITCQQEFEPLKHWAYQCISCYSRKKKIEKILASGKPLINHSAKMGMIQPPKGTVFFDQSNSDRPPWED